jgi:hypothetical protein
VDEHAVTVTERLAANGPVPASLAIGFDVLSTPLLRGGAAAIGLEVRLLGFVLVHCDLP